MENLIPYIAQFLPDTHSLMHTSTDWYRRLRENERDIIRGLYKKYPNYDTLSGILLHCIIIGDIESIQWISSLSSCTGDHLDSERKGIRYCITQEGWNRIQYLIPLAPFKDQVKIIRIIEHHLGARREDLLKEYGLSPLDMSMKVFTKEKIQSKDIEVIKGLLGSADMEMLNYAKPYLTDQIIQNIFSNESLASTLRLPFLSLDWLIQNGYGHQIHTLASMIYMLILPIGSISFKKILYGIYQDRILYQYMKAYIFNLDLYDVYLYLADPSNGYSQDLFGKMSYPLYPRARGRVLKALAMDNRISGYLEDSLSKSSIGSFHIRMIEAINLYNRYVDNSPMSQNNIDMASRIAAKNGWVEILDSIYS